MLFIVVDSKAYAGNKNYLEHYNRNMFQFNQDVDHYALKPIAEGYNTIVPELVRIGVDNVYNNMRVLPTIGNDILQLHLYDALHDSWRFIFNTTAGLGGIFDVASHIGLKPHYTDLGLTFALWGWRQSHYFVLPIIGPSTIRDSLSYFTEYYAMTVYPWIEPFAARASVFALRIVSLRASALQYEGIMSQAAFDPFIFRRNAYLQLRKRKIEDTMAGSDWRPLAKQYVCERKPALMSVNPYMPDNLSPI